MSAAFSGKRVDHPRTKFVFVPDGKHNFDVALDGDGSQVQHGSVQSNPSDGFSIDEDTEKVANSSSEANRKDPHEEGDDKHGGAVEIKAHLIHKENVEQFLLHLLRCRQKSDFLAFRQNVSLQFFLTTLGAARLLTSFSCPP